jgi:hypothetical protein
MSKKKKEPVYKSMEQFEKAFIPEAFRKDLTESLDIQTLATRMAKKALAKTRLKRVK